MKKYKYTRKKHVEEIKKICSKMEIDYTGKYFDEKISNVLTQCNLLLQTKKTKKKYPLPFEKETLEGLKKITILVERV